MDVDEEVVEEFPVFLSKTLENNLFVLQFPNTTRPSDLDCATVVNCCVKPINHEVKIDFGLDTESEHYDKFKGQQFAIASDGKNQKDSKIDRPSFKSGIMDKQAFVGMKPIENVNKYCVGLFQDNELHLTPLANILQMRPTFSYFDKDDKRKKAEQKAANEDDDDEELQQVTVKFSRTDTERLKGKQKIESPISKSSDEPWCETLWHSRLSPTAEIEQLKLLASIREPMNYSSSLDAKKYIEQLIPQERSDQSLEAILPSKIISKSKLKTLNLTDQLKNILKDGKMLSFGDIMSILEECDKNITTEKVINII